ncbi:hypothetical protein EDD18DRAFT_1151064 [Armillaria luteobubalina]|uniref:Uncharacterized protein n=1 Tax=Armillaria luteobubalina TaxID=153913 RepID=A0AA39TSG7_9AGAR|nr:hypothetical protein EDD18DRAFT_1151064 [Armillaria luteobubalina]
MIAIKHVFRVANATEILLLVMSMVYPGFASLPDCEYIHFGTEFIHVLVPVMAHNVQRHSTTARAQLLCCRDYRRRDYLLRRRVYSMIATTRLAGPIDGIQSGPIQPRVSHRK